MDDPFSTFSTPELRAAEMHSPPERVYGRGHPPGHRPRVQSFEDWLRDEFVADPRLERKSERARELRDENQRRLLVHLQRCPRAARVS